MEKLALSIAEAAETLGLGRDQIYLLLNTGRIASFKIGHRRLIPAAGLRDFVERQMREPEPAASR